MLPKGDQNYAYLRIIRLSEGMKSFKDFLIWYNNKDVVPTQEAMQKMIEFLHQEEIDFLKLGCTLPNLATICLHKSTDSKFNWKRQRLFEEDMWRYGWWSLHCLYRQGCGWRKFYTQINQFVRVNCRHRRKPTLCLFDVSTNAYWIVYKMELWLRISKFQASTE